MITTTTNQRYSSDATSSRTAKFFKLLTLIGLFFCFLFGSIIVRYLTLGFYRVNFGMLRKFIEMRQSLL